MSDKISTDTEQGTASRQQAVVMPWDQRARELEESEGAYCVYAAWSEWLDKWNDEQSPNLQLDLDQLDKTSLFMAFQAACSETRQA